MNEKVCNFWIEPADYRAIPTNGARNSDGTAVMESGIALEAKKRFSDLEIDLGRLLASRGNHVHVLRPGLVSFPVKQFRWSGVDLQVIERSARELSELVGDAKTLLPRPTIGEKGAEWDEVAKVLAFLPDNILVIQHT
jgi:hypothetical protein